MVINTEINDKDILEQVKLSLQLPGIIEQILMRRIVQSEAESVNITADKIELQKASDDFRERNKLLRAENTKTWLRINRISIDEYEEIIRLELLGNKLKKMLLADKVEGYFYQNQSDFDQVVIYEVILENKELATELYYAIREGELQFQDVARKYIVDTELKRKGGYLGQIQRKDLSMTLRPIFSITSFPQIFKPLPTAEGFNLIWVEEIIKASLDEKTRQEIEFQLFINFLKEKITTDQ
jgi:parvulin-like peptidyl-prolyl isomerase